MLKQEHAVKNAYDDGFALDMLSPCRLSAIGTCHQEKYVLVLAVYILYKMVFNGGQSDLS